MHLVSTTQFAIFPAFNRPFNRQSCILIGNPNINVEELLHSLNRWLQLNRTYAFNSATILEALSFQDGDTLESA